MKYLLLLGLFLFLFSIYFFQAGIKSLVEKKVQAEKISVEDNTKVEASTKIDPKRVKKSPTKTLKKRTSKKAKKKLTLEEISKSTAFVISGTGNSIKTGSGFFITESLLVTNSHVVENALIQEDVKVVFIETKQGVKDRGLVFIEDKKSDLAIIKTIKKTHKPLKLGKYSKVKMGDEIFVLGSPQGLVGTLSKGIVSAKRKENDFQILQITAPVSQGSSGSPVLSKDLEVIGIVVAILESGQNINFAVPVNYLEKLIQDNKKDFVEVNEMNLEKILEEMIVPSKSKKSQELRTDFEKGSYYYSIEDYKQAVYWYKKAAKQGHINAQFILGGVYYEGTGVSQDYKQAFLLVQEGGNTRTDYISVCRRSDVL